MANLAVNRYIKPVGDGLPKYTDIAIKATTHLYEGAMVARHSGGFLVTGTAAGGGFAQGVTLAEYANDAGADGDVSARVRSGQFWMDNGDAIADADRMKPCFMSDDHTVNKSSTGNRQLAGVVLAVDTELGVLVLIDPVLNAILSLYSSVAVQGGSGALTAGALAIATGITITANSRVVVTHNTPAGTFNPSWKVATRVVGGPGTGAITIQALQTAGGNEAAATGTVDYVIFG